MRQSKEDRAFVEKVRTVGGIVKGGTPKFYRHNIGKDLTSLYRENGNSMADVVKDPVIYKHIVKGNPSDPKLKADVTAVERYKHDDKINKRRSEKKERIKTLKEKYRAKYGKNAGI